MVLATAVVYLALITEQGQKLFILLLLVVVPSTLASLLLPFALPYLHIRLLALSALQGILTGPLICLAPLLRLKSVPSSWHTTAQELGLTKSGRLRLLRLPLLSPPLLLSLITATLLGFLGAMALLKISSS